MTYAIITCVALPLSGIFGTLFFLDQTGKINVTDRQAFWIIGIYTVSSMAGIIFLGNLVAGIANLN